MSKKAGGWIVVTNHNLRSRIITWLWYFKIKGWPVIIWHEIVSIILSLTLSGIFVWETIEVSTHSKGPDIFNSKWLYITQFVFTIFFVYDFTLFFLIEEMKIYYIIKPVAVVDMITIFVSVGGIIFQRSFYGLQFIIFIRFYLSLKVLLQGQWSVKIPKTDVVIRHEMLSLVISLLAVLTLLITAAGFFFVIENYHENAGGKIDTILDSFYFMTVTISTVGYGDFSPSSALGKVFIILFLVGIIILIPIEITRMLDNIDRIKKNSYTTESDHVVVCSDFINAIQFVKEFYHPDRGINTPKEKTVIISDVDTLTLEQETVLKRPYFNSRVQILHGDPTTQDTLMRARIQQAVACFIMSSRHVEDTKAADNNAMLTALAVKALKPKIKIFIQITNSSLIKTLKSAGIEHIICLETLEMSVMAQSLICKGFPTLLSNLLTTYGSTNSKFEQEWERDYAHGYESEMYIMPIPQILEGKLFKQASQIVYSYSNGEVLLFGMKNQGNMMLSPLEERIEPGDIGLFIASDYRTVYRLNKLTDVIVDKMEGSVTSTISLCQHSLSGSKRSIYSRLRTETDSYTERTQARFGALGFLPEKHDFFRHSY